MKVFLGGTCNGSKWREETVIPQLTIDYFDPNLPPGVSWDAEKQQIEELEKANSDIKLYYLTPESESLYSVAEVVDDSNKVPEKVIYFFGNYAGKEFNEHQEKRLIKVGKLIESNGAKWAKTTDELIQMLNTLGQ